MLIINFEDQLIMYPPIQKKKMDKKQSVLI